MTKRGYNNLVFRRDTNDRLIGEHRRENELLKIAILGSDSSDVMLEYQVKKYKHNQECITMLENINIDIMAAIDKCYYNN